MLELLTLPLRDLQTQGSLLTSIDTMSCGVKRRSYRDESMTLGWLGINGRIRTTRCSIVSKQLKLAHTYTPISRGKHMPPASVTTLIQPSPQESPLQMSFMDKSLTPLTASPCPGYMMKKGQGLAAG